MDHGLLSLSSIDVLICSMKVVLRILFLDAIASPSTYPCQWVSGSVSDSKFQIWRYPISELCELVSLVPPKKLGTSEKITLYDKLCSVYFTLGNHT